MKKKLIITGASGFLGYHLLRVASVDWEVYGITNSKSFDFKEATVINCDIRNYIELGNFIDDIEPDAIIHAAAIADANFCEQNKDFSYEVNVEATKNLAGICCDFHIPFAFTSTDLVFDGTKGMYKEDAQKNPLSVYGEQKSIAEEEVLRIYPEATVFRLPLMFGIPEASVSNYLQKFISQLKNGEKAALFFDEYRSICGARSIAEGILKLMNETGIIHLAGKERLSRYEFGVKAANSFQLNESLLLSCSQKDVKMAAPRPADVSLDISKAVSLGFAPLGVDEELKLIADKKYFE
ncbi:MAG: NAD(P)-dependent oxidoreductase [Bacteroidetes bacterium]|nr:NAD(P)-dependent oxidoreductase [Bacteroidota bacterium]